MYASARQDSAAVRLAHASGSLRCSKRVTMALRHRVRGTASAASEREPHMQATLRRRKTVALECTDAAACLDSTRSAVKYQAHLRSAAKYQGPPAKRGAGGRHRWRLASMMSPTLSVSSVSSSTSRSTSAIHCSSTPALPYLRAEGTEASSDRKHWVIGSIE